MRSSIATVCISGTLAEKMAACAEAGFDGIEVFEPDLVASDLSPEEVRARAARLGLSLDLYQPFRDFEGVDDDLFAANLERARAKFELMGRLGIDTALFCSNVATASVDDDEVIAAQLRAAADLAAEYGVRIAYEALAWGRYVDDYRRAWRIVQRADHPALGICLDSFHVLSRGHDTSTISEIDAEKIFFVQLADAPALQMDVLSWSRHHRLFPGEGIFDLVDFVARILGTGYSGPLSLEVFNDVFRRTDTRRTALHAHRSLLWLEDAVRRADPTSASDLTGLDAPQEPSRHDFVELRGRQTDRIETMLDQLGFQLRGRHRTKPVRLWSSGSARIVVADAPSDEVAVVSGLGLAVADPASAARRAEVLRVPRVFRRTYHGEAQLYGFRAPDGTEVFFGADGSDAEHGQEPGWVTEFADGDLAPRQGAVTAIDHVNLTQPWQDYDEAVLFYAGVAGLTPQSPTEVAAPRGLVRSQVMRSECGCVRIPLNVAPGDGSGHAAHIAFATDDIDSVARAALGAGLRMLPIGANYYDDLAARFGLPEEEIARLRELGLMYDRDADGEFWHFYTAIVGELFLEVVQRRGYAGYGAANAPIRLAAQQRAERN